MIEETTQTCRGCGGTVERGRLWHSACKDRYRRSTDYRTAGLERDGYACASCFSWKNDLLLKDRATGRLRFAPWAVRTVEADHIVPLGLGGGNDSQNIQMLCVRHHKKKTRVDNAKIKGYRLSVSQGVVLAWVVVVAAVLAFGWWATANMNAVSFRRAAVFLVTVGVVVGILLWLRRWTTLTVTRLYESLATETGDSYTAKGRVRVHRWGRADGRFVPTDFTLHYPHIYEDNDADRQTALEQRAASKLGWDSHIARWRTSRDEVRLTSPDPFVVNPPHVWAGPPASIWEPIPVGLSATGAPVNVSLVERNLLVGGEPGSGKSVGLSIILAAAAADPNVSLYLADGKGTELCSWEPCSAGSVVTKDDFQQMLEHLLDLIVQRNILLRAEGRRKIERDDDLGLIVLVIDELAEFLSGSRANKEEVFEPLRRIVSLGRSTGVITVAATQRPSFEIVPTDLRDLFGFRWALRSTTPSSSDMTLGQGWASQGFSASKIGPRAKGAGYLLAEDGVPVLMRSSYIDDEALAKWARYAQQTRALALSQQVSGPEAGFSLDTADGAQEPWVPGQARDLWLPGELDGEGLDGRDG